MTPAERRRDAGRAGVTRHTSPSHVGGVVRDGVWARDAGSRQRPRFSEQAVGGQAAVSVHHGRLMHRCPAPGDGPPPGTSNARAGRLRRGTNRMLRVFLRQPWTNVAGGG